jgi:hypothetical protein
VKRRSRSGRLGPETAIGFAGFDRDQWLQMAEVAEDRTAMDASFEEWETNALDALRTFASKGVTVEKVPVDVAAFADWCRSRKLPLTSGSRAKYVSSVMQSRAKGLSGRGDR